MEVQLQEKNSALLEYLIVAASQMVITMASSATSFPQGSYLVMLVLLERALVLEVEIAEEWL